MEKVFCLERALINPEWTKKEVSINLKSKDLAKIDIKAFNWLDRNKAELNPNYKQVIPYAIVINNNEKIACYPRNGDENRLHGLWSIGIGGHINKEDDCTDDIEATIGTALKRELSEEFLDWNYEKISNYTFKGVINDESVEVGKVHIGFVYVINTTKTPIADEELKGLIWLKKEELENYNLETWSKLALKLI